MCIQTHRHTPWLLCTDHIHPQGAGLRLSLLHCCCCCCILQGGSNWQALQRLLVRCVLPALGAQQPGQAQAVGIVPGGGLRDLGGAPLPAQQVREAAVMGYHALTTQISSMAACKRVFLVLSGLRIVQWCGAHAR